MLPELPAAVAAKLKLKVPDVRVDGESGCGVALRVVSSAFPCWRPSCLLHCVTVPSPAAHSFHVAATALAAVLAAVEDVQQKLDEVLFMPPSIVLPPTASSEPQHSERVVQRALDVDAGLRALLKTGTLERTPFASAFGSSKHLAPVLAEKHLVFYRLVNKMVVFESALVQRVVAAVLGGPQHAARKELAQKLQEWQQANAELAAARDAEGSASQALADAMKVWEAEKAEADKTWFGRQQPSKPAVERKNAAAVNRDAAVNTRNAAKIRREKAEEGLVTIAARIAELRPLVPSTPFSSS